MHYFSKSLIVICRYHHFTHRAANHCCQSLSFFKLRFFHKMFTFGIDHMVIITNHSVLNILMLSILNQYSTQLFMFIPGVISSKFVQIDNPKWCACFIAKTYNFR